MMRVYGKGERRKDDAASKCRRLTKRAPDAGESAAISGSFLRLSLFLAGRLRRPRPSAGNANRSALDITEHQGNQNAIRRCTNL